MDCREFREVADSHLDDESAIESEGELRRHLDGCPECRRELTARREVRAALRRGITRSPDLQLRTEFAFRLRNDLKATLRQPEHKSIFTSFSISRPQWIAFAACLLVAVMAGIVALTTQQTSTTPQEVGRVERAEADARRLDGVAVRLAKLEQTKTAVGDHRFCALDYQLAEEPIPLDEAGKRYDAAYTDLEEAVMSGQGQKAGDIRLVEEHSCVYNGRRFAHVVLEHRGRTVSVLVTEKLGAGDTTFAAKSSVGTPDNQAVVCAQIEGYQVSCIETRLHAIYIVSDLSEAENLAVARSFAPSLSEHITRAEGVA